jgi:hypothetical protein
MSAVHRLCVVRWVPVVIIEDDSVCGSQVDAQTTCTSTEQKDEDIRTTAMSEMVQNNREVKEQTESASP